MNILTILLSLAILAVGFVGGMTFATIYNSSLINDLKAENRKLRHDYVLLKKSKKDTIEIIYPKKESESLFDPF